MYLWQICLLIIVFVTPIGLLLRKYADSVIDNSTLSWKKDGHEIFKMVKRVNGFLWVILALEGLITNLALVGLVISIPIFFIWRI